MKCKRQEIRCLVVTTLVSTAVEVTTTGVARVTTAGETTTGGTTLTFSGNLDTDVTTIEGLTIELGNNGIGLFLGTDGDETETTGATSLAIGQDDGVKNSGVLGELSLERLLVSSPGKTTDEQLNGHGKRERCEREREGINEPVEASLKLPGRQGLAFYTSEF